MSVSSEMHNDLAIAFMKEYILLFLHAGLIQYLLKTKILFSLIYPWFKCGEVDTSQFSM